MSELKFRMPQTVGFKIAVGNVRKAAANVPRFAAVVCTVPLAAAIVGTAVFEEITEETPLPEHILLRDAAGYVLRDSSGAIITVEG